ncbi:bifunctional methylenetetrahydrofolate dehydrogenase/cyclohydrolase, putative [Plasmodium ovale]|uniref:Bifunctional methylenetetrahydrofolate dehydrogenase/cyclohydrolase, putative n=1 Tax=Plasmodium ovale TaxID=36330 RepID=A0A1D3TJ73_PLAOA|nr:bifunctional methylenetetrahydrofolate dehydrogenase/cyclohydrolase, putative [Plasmodium ovale]
MMNNSSLNGYPIAEIIDELIFQRIEFDRRRKLKKGKLPRKKKLYIIYSKNVVTYSYLYILLKKSIFLRAAIIFVLIQIDRKYSQERVTKLIKKINGKGKNTALIVLSPLSYHINKCYISKFIHEEKDIDGSNYEALLKLFSTCNGHYSSTEPMTAFAAISKYISTNTNREKCSQLQNVHLYVQQHELPFVQIFHYFYHNWGVTPLETFFTIWYIRILKELKCIFISEIIEHILSVNNIMRIFKKVEFYQNKDEQVYICEQNNISNDGDDNDGDDNGGDDNGGDDNDGDDNDGEDNGGDDNNGDDNDGDDNDGSRNDDDNNNTKYMSDIIIFNKKLLIYNHLKEYIKYNIPCCVHAIILFIKYYNIKIENKNILIVNNNINIFLSLFYFFFKYNISTTVYDPISGNIICRYKKKYTNKKLYFYTNKGKLFIKKWDDFKKKINIFTDWYINYINTYSTLINNKNKLIKKNLKKKIIKNSDLVIIGIGFSNVLKKDHIKKDAVILDLGINLIYPQNVVKLNKMETSKYRIWSKRKLGLSNFVYTKGNYWNKNKQFWEYFSIGKNFIHVRTLAGRDTINREENMNFLFKTEGAYTIMKRECLFTLVRYIFQMYSSNTQYKNEESSSMRRHFVNKDEKGLVVKESPSLHVHKKGGKQNGNKWTNQILLKDDKSKLRFVNILGNALKRYEIVGDAHLNCKKRCNIISSVPGGLGPITTSVLFYNLFFR